MKIRFLTLAQQEFNEANHPRNKNGTGSQFSLNKIKQKIKEKKYDESGSAY
jgi:hypothetical protein